MKNKTAAKPVFEPKHWLEYGIEFLMLFLAVSLGFFAESYREYLKDKEDGTEYVEAMIVDLQSDSAKVAVCINNCQKQLAGLDSLTNLALQAPISGTAINELYNLKAKYTGSSYAVDFTKRTSTQLLNAGGMRLIKNKKITDCIVSYIESVDDVKLQGDLFEKMLFQNTLNLDVKLFNEKYLRQNNNMEQQENNFSLVKNNTDLLLEYGNTIANTNDVLNLYIEKLKEIQQEITENSSLLKAENK